MQKSESDLKKEPKKDETVARQAKKLQSENYWKEVVNILKSKGKITLFTNLINAKAAEINDMQLAIVGLSAFGKRIVEQPENKKEIEDAIMQVTGKKMYITIDEEKNVISKKEENNKLDGIDIPINIIEE